MRIAVFGAGGIGGYLGARLAQVGEDVTLIARGAHLSAIRRDGLRVDSTKGDFVMRPALATDDPTEVGSVDVVILGVKAWQVVEAVDAIRPMIGPETAVVPVQNGVDAPSQVAEALGREHVLIGLCYIRGRIVGPGHIRHTVEVEPNVYLGEMDNARSRRLEQLREAFERSNMSVVVPEDIHVALWEKLVAAGTFAGLGAVTRMPIGVWRSLPQTRKMSEQGGHEAVKVAQACGINLSADYVEYLKGVRDRFAPDYSPSLQQDIIDGRPSELEVWFGTVVRLGREVGVETPVNEFIYNTLLPQEMRARGHLEFPG